MAFWNKEFDVKLLTNSNLTWTTLCKALIHHDKISFQQPSYTGFTEYYSVKIDSKIHIKDIKIWCLPAPAEFARIVIFTENSICCYCFEDDELKVFNFSNNLTWSKKHFKTFFSFWKNNSILIVMEWVLSIKIFSMHGMLIPSTDSVYLTIGRVAHVQPSSWFEMKLVRNPRYQTLEKNWNLSWNG